MRTISRFMWASAAAFVMTGCAASGNPGQSGSLEVSLDLQGDITIHQVDWVITGNGMEPMSGTIDTMAPGSTASVEVFGLPPGEGYLIEMTAIATDEATSCGGSAEFDVVTGVSTPIMVMLSCKPPEDLGGVRVNGKLNVCADLVKAVVSPLQTSVGNDIALSARGEDYEGDAIEYRWEATGGSIDDPGAAETFYTCEEVGDQQVRVIVSDDGFEQCNCDWTVPITCVEGSGAECSVDDDCDEGEICVDGACVPDAECAVDDDCDDGEICIDGACVPDVECSVDGDCDDGDLCTVDACLDGACVHSEVACDDGNECTVGMCDPSTGTCDFVSVEDGIECDEGNGVCMSGECRTNELLGTEFVVVFQANYYANPQLTLFLSGPTATDGVVSIASSGFSAPFSVSPGAVTTVELPTGSQIESSDVVETAIAVRVSAEEQITAYGLNRLTQTTDAFAALPTESLGERYRVMAWPGSINGPSQLAIAAPGEDMEAVTNVTITPSADAGARMAGVPYTVELGAFDAYQLQSDGDLTGTLIEADGPIAVFGGNRCGNVPGPNTGFCDHLVEQLPPVSSWGVEALTIPLGTRSFGDTFVFLADQAATTVSIEGAAAETFTLGAGESAQRLLEGTHRVTADRPILVAQLSNGSEWDGVTADPFMMLVPTATQFVSAYTFATPGTGFSVNFANVVALTTDASAGAVELDGSPVSPSEFTAILGTSYSAAQLSIDVGTHTLEAPNPLGLYVYGYADYDSYGYPGGFSVAIAP